MVREMLTIYTHNFVEMEGEQTNGSRNCLKNESHRPTRNHGRWKFLTCVNHRQSQRAIHEPKEKKKKEKVSRRFERKMDKKKNREKSGGKK